MSVFEEAKMTAQTLSFAVNMHLAQHMPTGTEARVHNFVFADLPVMLHHAGQPIDQITPHQRTLLDMPAADFRRQAERNYEAASQALGWNAPQIDYEVKKFMGHGTLERSEVAKLLDHYEATHDQFISPSQNIRANAVIINHDHEPLEAEMFNNVSQYMREEGNFLSGMEVRLKNDPQGDIVREVEASVIKAEGSNMYTTHHKVSGLTRLIDQQELIDNRGLEHFYGVIVEDEKGQHYMVKIQEQNSNPHVLSSNVREVSGIAGAYIQRDSKNLGDALFMENCQVQNISLQATCGEFTMRNLRGYDDNKGPVVLISSPWQSKPDQRELDIAYHEVQAYKARYERTPEDHVRIISKKHDNRLEEPEIPAAAKPQSRDLAQALAAGAFGAGQGI